MNTTMEEVVKLRKGRYIVVDDHPCKIVNIQTSATGKHGHAKSRIDSISLFDGSKKILLKPSDAKVDVPIVEKKQAQVLSVSGKNVQLMDLASYETFDLEIPENMALNPSETIYYWIVMGKRLLERSD
jgi:translation initiation factor 5A